MAMLAGYGTFLLEAVLPQVPSRRNMLGVARMAVTWNVDHLVEQLSRLGITYDSRVVDEIRARNHMFTTAEFFRLVGFERYDDIDLDDSEGVTIVHDMNTPVPADLHERYDFVFENGTIEHIFDLKTAMGNIAHMVRTGGWVSHGAPLDALNHGFYNFSINFFNDFYRANGFDDLQFYLVRYAANWHQNQNVLVEPLGYTHEEFYFSPEMYSSEFNKTYIACLARKVEHVVPVRTPTQASYDPAAGLDSRLTR
jgi:hypothetical protein